jgi:hypothetical protein
MIQSVEVRSELVPTVVMRDGTAQREAPGTSSIERVHVSPSQNRPYPCSERRVCTALERERNVRTTRRSITRRITPVPETTPGSSPS